MRFHWAAEFATAVALVAGGLGLLAGWPRALPVYAAALGMLLHTAMNSPGCFAQRRPWAPLAMFALLLVLAVVSLGLVLAVG
jgi:hypothetical protein